jgi:hypothetical protein
MTKAMRATAPLLMLSAALLATPALAQPGRDGPDPVGASGPEDTDKIKQVVVYGDDPCPPSADSGEIVICARLPDKDRYRIPEELRSDPNSARNQSWANRARSFETVGAAGINSCSPTGAGGFTGCFAQLARQMKEERKAYLGGSTWADAVAAERARRLGTIDADSAAIEQQAKEDEALAAARAKQEAEARARLEAEEKKSGPKQ